MSSEIYNNNYKSIYNLRLNTINFTSTRGKIWHKNEPDVFIREPIENIPRETKVKIFSNELIRLVDNKQVNAQKIQQSVKKYLPNVDVKIISMDDYTEFGLNNKKRVAAATRPVFDKNGKLQKLEIFIPNIDYGDKNSKLAFIEYVVHEIIHAMQYAEDKETRIQHANTKEGHFYNFFQQNISNMLTDILVQKALVSIAREKKLEIHSLDDYNDFINSPMNDIDENKIMEINGYDNKEKFNEYINAGFEVFIKELMTNLQITKDPFAMKIIDEAGGLEGFKNKVREMTVYTLLKEQEAYTAGNNARKTACGFNGENYNDIIPLIAGMSAEALQNQTKQIS